MKTSHLIPLIIVIYNVTLQAAQVKPFFQKNSLGVTLQDLQYPTHFEKNLRSGLTHRFQFNIRTDLPFLSETVRTINIKYDLWSEKYQIAIEEHPSKQFVENVNLEKLNLILKRIQFKNLLPAKQLSDTVTFSMNIQIRLNPIEKERIKAIQKWIVENSTTQPLSFSSDTSIPKLMLPAKKKTLFSWIFNQNTEKMSEASEWQITTPSISIHRESIPHED